MISELYFVFRVTILTSNLCDNYLAYNCPLSVILEAYNCPLSVILEVNNGLQRVITGAHNCPLILILKLLIVLKV